MLNNAEKEVFSRITARVEKELIVRTLRQTGGHQGRASEILGIDRKTLRTKLRDLGITLDRIVTEAINE
jgi:two-component system, NtrC family, nitrogen regulation response regulator GlnG